MAANANKTVNLLDTTQEETEVPDLDQTLTLEEGQEDITTNRERNMGKRPRMAWEKARGIR